MPYFLRAEELLHGNCLQFIMIAIVERECYKVQPTEMVGVMDMMSISGVKEVMKSAPASKYNLRQAYPAMDTPAVTAG